MEIMIRLYDFGCPVAGWIKSFLRLGYGMLEDAREGQRLKYRVSVEL